MADFEKFHFEHLYYGSRRLAIQFEMSREKSQRLMRDIQIPKERIKSIKSTCCWIIISLPQILLSDF
jgi:hypothetical protein